MSRKRALKKQQKSRETLLARLEALEHRGADAELLALAAKELPGAGGELAERWNAMAERILRRALARGDFDSISRLLLLCSTSREHPLFVLAAAVVDLAAGRTEAARAKLDALAAGGLGEDVDGELLPALSALAGRAPETPEAVKLRLTLTKLAAEGSPSKRLQTSVRQAIENFRRATPASETALLRLLDHAERCLSLIEELSALETKLARPGRKPKETAIQIVLATLHHRGTTLAAALAETAPLLAPLRHVLRSRWRAVLEAVAAREGAEGLAVLAATRPELVGPELDLPPGGLTSTGFQQARRIRSLLANEEHEEAAGLLRARARGEKEPTDLAALWSLELWVMKRQDATDDDPFESEPSEPTLHQILMRIEAMAAEIGRRFPAEQHPEVARVLRNELLDLCEAIPFCEHTAGAASALLAPLAGDAGLLIAGITGAIAGDDIRCLRALGNQLTRRGQLRAPERETALRLMTQVAAETPATLARALEVLRPLFSEKDWEETVEQVAYDMAPGFSTLYREMASSPWIGPEGRSAEHQLLRRDLERLRPALGNTRAFAAVELVFDCWEPEGPTTRQRTQAFLRRFEGYEAGLLALDMLRRTLCAAAPLSFTEVLQELADTTIDRLDERWPQWLPSVSLLAMGGSRGGMKRLEKKIRRLLGARGLDMETHLQLEDALDAVRDVERLKREILQSDTPSKTSGKGGSGRSTRRRTARRRTGSPGGGYQLDLDLG